MRKLGYLVAALVAIWLIVHFTVPPVVDGKLNRVLTSGPHDRVSARAKQLHESLVIADLHADTLLWQRPFLERSDRGQVDLPRLQQANVALQVFSLPTRVPKNRSRHGTPADQLDMITIAAVTQWPPNTWSSRTQRALHVANKLERAARKSEGRLMVVRSRGDLDKLLAARTSRANTVGGLLALEGLHALDGKVHHVDRLWKAGYRMAGLVHQFDNEIGGSSQGVARGGLTPFGREVVERMEKRGMIIDLAHASPKLIDDVLASTGGPLVVSHTGLQSVCDRPRNLSDNHLRRIAARGGVIGIGYWYGAVCGPDAKAVARSIRHAVRVAGIDHVALGSDFDGDKMPFDATGLVQITEALLDEGFSQREIRMIMGGNTIRLLHDALPKS